MDTWYAVLPNNFLLLIFIIYIYINLYYILYILYDMYYIFDIFFLGIIISLFDILALNQISSVLLGTVSEIIWAEVIVILLPIKFGACFFFITIKTFATAFTTWICISIFSKRQKFISLYKYCIRSLDSAK